MTTNSARARRRYVTGGKVVTIATVEVDVSKLTDGQQTEFLLRGLEALTKLAQELEWEPVKEPPYRPHIGDPASM